MVEVFQKSVDRKKKNCTKFLNALEKKLWWILLRILDQLAICHFDIKREMNFDTAVLPIWIRLIRGNFTNKKYHIS